MKLLLGGKQYAVEKDRYNTKFELYICWYVSGGTSRASIGRTIGETSIVIWFSLSKDRKILDEKIFISEHEKITNINNEGCDKSESHFFKNYSVFVHYQLPIHKMGIRGSDGVLGNVLWDEQ